MVTAPETPRRTARPRPAPARVLWREVPEWHSLPGDPSRVLDEGVRAYRRAAGLHEPAPMGRRADARA